MGIVEFPGDSYSGLCVVSCQLEPPDGFHCGELLWMECAALSKVMVLSGRGGRRIHADQSEKMSKCPFHRDSQRVGGDLCSPSAVDPPC